MRSIVGNNLLIFRKVTGHKQENFANLIGKAPSTLSEIENGIGDIRSSEVIKIENMFHLPHGRLLDPHIAQQIKKVVDKIVRSQKNAK